MAIKTPPERVLLPTVEQDVAEFAALLSGTLRDLKSVGPPPAAIREALDRGALNERHKPALLAVAAAGPISVSELAKRLGLLLSSTSTIVGELSRAGLLERGEDEHDRRRTIVRLHADYSEAMEAWLELAFGPLSKALERLSPQARAHFMEGWRLLHEEAGLRASSAPQGDCAAGL